MTAFPLASRSGVFQQTRMTANGICKSCVLRLMNVAASEDGAATATTADTGAGNARRVQRAAGDRYTKRMLHKARGCLDYVVRKFGVRYRPRDLGKLMSYAGRTDFTLTPAMPC